MLADDVNSLLNDKKLLLTEVYFKLQEHFEKKYGSNTVIFMEIGTFVEVYEVNNDEMKVGKAKEIAELLNIQLTRKSKAILENNVSNPLLAGVPALSSPVLLSLYTSHRWALFDLPWTRFGSPAPRVLRH